MNYFLLSLDTNYKLVEKNLFFECSVFFCFFHFCIHINNTISQKVGVQ